jgi:photosynthetic reaction center cytochrome c subunit
MSRAINVDYIEPLAPVFPANRLGPLGDPLKVACATCHQGQRRPLGGVSMLADHQALAGPRPLAVSADGSTEMSGETPASSEAVTP